MAKVECGGTKQEVNYLQSIGCARVDAADTGDRESALRSVDRALEVALESHSRGGAPAVRENRDDLRLVDHVAQDSEGELLIRPLAGMSVSFELGADIAILLVGYVTAEVDFVGGEEQVHHVLGEFKPTRATARGGLVECRPVQLLPELMLVTEVLYVPDQLCRVDELEHADSEVSIPLIHDASLVEEQGRRRMVGRKAER